MSSVAFTATKPGRFSILLSSTLAAAGSVHGQEAARPAVGTGAPALETILAFEAAHRTDKPRGWGGEPMATISLDGEIVHQESGRRAWSGQPRATVSARRSPTACRSTSAARRSSCAAISAPKA